jgi:hypothetical protein
MWFLNVARRVTGRDKFNCKAGLEILHAGKYGRKDDIERATCSTIEKAVQVLIW